MPKDPKQRMQEYHDIIKVHPYRQDFAREYAGDYNFLMYELSKAWSDYIYYTPDQTPYEKEKLRMFAWWIHDFRQVLGYSSNFFPAYFFNYYEQMLQVTHRFLITGEYDVFYNPEDILEKSSGKKMRASVKYQFVTKDMCGIDSEILPCYLPTNYKFNINQDDVINYFNTYWTYKNMTDEERTKIIAYWYKNTLPVLEWINNNCKEDTYVFPLWKSIRTSKSRLKDIEEDV